MGVLLAVDGFLGMSFQTLNGIEVDDKVEKEIGEKLKDGEYVIGITTGLVSDLRNFKPMYKFTLSSYDNEYNFEIED